MENIMSMTTNAEKDFIEKMKQQQEEQHMKIQQHFEERLKEARENHINVAGSPDDDFNSFIKDIFISYPPHKWMSLKMVSPGNANLRGQLPTNKWMSL